MRIVLMLFVGLFAVGAPVVAEAQQNASQGSSRNDPNDPQFQLKPDLRAIYVIDEGNTAKIVVANNGKVRSSATKVRLYIKPYGPGRPTVRVLDLSPLEPNATKIFSVRGLALSNSSMSVLVDYGNRVSESDENNNVAFHEVEDQLTGAADMAITKMQFFANEKQVWVTVHNYGRKEVRKANVRLESKFGLKVNEKMFYTMKNLKPGTFQIFRFFPKEMQRGMQFESVVDLNNDVPETNEGNNRLVRTF